MDLQESRRVASELSGGVSTTVIKDVVIQSLKNENAKGSVLDFGGGKGELLNRLYNLQRFESLVGVDLFPRPDNLPSEVYWHQQDLNEDIILDRQFDTIICMEVIEHLENPRHTFRCFYSLLKPGGFLIVTTPNQESIRSYAGLLFGGHFTHFLGASYPAHITPLLRLDFTRICQEVGFTPPTFKFTNQGGIPKRPQITWQQLSLGLLQGRLFSDNIVVITRRPIQN